MNLQQAYQEIQSRINQVDFSRLWRGFERTKFALYDDEACFFDNAFIDKTAAFIANTTIPYNGENIAIWYLPEPPKDYDRLAASLIHEMFHAFQKSSGETRWADEKEALFRYRYDPLNLSAKLEEAKLIQSILSGGDGADFETLLSIRKRRQKMFPYEYAYEARVEQIEGSANDVELRALEQLNPDKAKEKWAGSLAEILDPARYFPIRIVSYSVGALFLACIRKCATFDFESFSEVPFSLEILETAKPGARLPRCSETITRLLENDRTETETTIQNALAKQDIVLKGSYPLISLNIYDARWNGRYATSRYFVAFKDGDEDKVLQGDFVIEIDPDYNILTIYRQ